MGDGFQERLYDLEGRHWWYRARYRIVMSLLSSWLPGGDAGGRVCDIGCGGGTLLRMLSAEGYDATGVDASDAALAHCRRRGVTARRGVLPDALDLPRGHFDAALLLDVLEHVDDDVAAWASAMDVVKPDGLLVATVPAWPWLWTSHDTRQGHHRRYRLRDFRRLVASSPGGRALHVSYMNAALFPLAATSRLAGALLPRGASRAELHVPPRWVNRVLEGLFASERGALVRGNRLPFGLSLVAVVRRTRGATQRKERP